ncbi:DUF2726 domain-containing protein [Deinococcus pimensis]|uniref:DUF2726 domain-containing protein n=1 Tax=Deinococcus pimensis TaxID=309888 RepID=UPI00048A1FD4|nr:DUF2726 domain-containing protein [Deinococcus pimensis]
MPGFLLLLVVAAVMAFLLLSRNNSGASSGPHGSTSGTTPLPSVLPLKTKQYFFSRSENAFYRTLVTALDGQPYQVFPNVRLNDLFTITTEGKDRQATYARLRDKHVDFLIVSTSNYEPVCAIELDGPSHNSEVQQNRDAVKDLAFRSALLPLIRLSTKQTHTPATVLDALQAHLRLRLQA